MEHNTPIEIEEKPATSGWSSNYLEDLEERREKALAGGGEKRIASQHKKGKLTARERLEYLFDKGSFQEVGAFIESRFTDFGMKEKKLPGDGVITGLEQSTVFPFMLRLKTSLLWAVPMENTTAKK